MSKFKKNQNRKSPGINTSSLPDIVFMLLFFFMVATTMKDSEVKVSIKAPTASELIKIKDKRLVSYIYVGNPVAKLQSTYGTSPRIQLNDAFVKDIREIRAFVESERAKLPERDRARMTFSIKGDKEVRMGIITDIKQELRLMNALKINYSAVKGKVKN